MTDRFFPNPAVLRRLHAGPLGSYIDTYAALLAERGYARATSREYLRLVARLSRWLCKQRLRVDDLDEQRVNEFLEYRRRRGFIARSNAAALKALLKELRTAGIVRARIPHADNSPLHKIGAAYSQYLARERGLSQQTLANYLPVVRRFLTKRFGEGSIRLDELRATDITRFVLGYAHTMSPGRASLMVTALRSFLRFLHLRGEIATDLAGAVPTVPNWRFSTVPKFLEPAQVERLLKSCDQSTIIGQRDYAILLLLARLGLRAGEVAGLTLDDIDWEAGEISVRGKGARQDRLPLPSDVGKAVVRYLRHGRPRCATREVFIHSRAPCRGFVPTSISTIVRRAVGRAGLHPDLKGAHLLRHSLATGMLRRGASLAEIGEILRHRLPNTTEIYAKVALQALRALAQPWPRGAA